MLAEVRAQVQELRQGGVQPGLAVVLVGADAASQVYVRNKVLRAEEVGIRSLEHRLPADTTQAHLLTLIDRLNRDPEVNGILVQLRVARAHRRALCVASHQPAQGRGRLP